MKPPSSLCSLPSDERSMPSERPGGSRMKLSHPSVAAAGPLRPFAGVCNSLALRFALARRRAGRGRSAEACPSLRYGFPALLTFGSHRVTRFTHCVRCARTDAVSMFTKRAGTRADPKPAVLGGAYALRPRPARRLAGGGCSSSAWQRSTGSSGPRAVRRPSDFWYPSMSAGAVPFSGQTQSTHKADFEFRQRAANRRPRYASRAARSAVEH
jgi:hypothetical protein